MAEIGTGSCNGNEAEEGGAYPFFVRSQNIKAKNDFQYDEEAIIIPGEGGIGEIFHYVNGKYALHQRVYRIHFIDKTINVKFIYYYMKSNFKSFILKKAVSATVTSIRKPMIEKFEIPIPPLEVQEEIVKILDRFADYAAELQAELQARQEQHEFYRDKLLSFNNINKKGGGNLDENE
ncbi:restriction endonuclease subunit S [Paraprevotella clara]|uniref:restriction endonuclease subunit S n=1 Tax=Paraprevotella clara TaxID=454154 RepID=UPI004028B6B7